MANEATSNAARTVSWLMGLVAAILLGMVAFIFNGMNARIQALESQATSNTQRIVSQEAQHSNQREQTEYLNRRLDKIEEKIDDLRRGQRRIGGNS